MTNVEINVFLTCELKFLDFIGRCLWPRCWRIVFSTQFCALEQWSGVKIVQYAAKHCTRTLWAENSSHRGMIGAVLRATHKNVGNPACHIFGNTSEINGRATSLSHLSTQNTYRYVSEPYNVYIFHFRRNFVHTSPSDATKICHRKAKIKMVFSRLHCNFEIAWSNYVSDYKFEVDAQSYVDREILGEMVGNVDFLIQWRNLKTHKYDELYRRNLKQNRRIVSSKLKPVLGEPKCRGKNCNIEYYSVRRLNLYLRWLVVPLEYGIDAPGSLSEHSDPWFPRHRFPHHLALRRWRNWNTNTNEWYAIHAPYANKTTKPNTMISLAHIATYFGHFEGHCSNNWRGDKTINEPPFGQKSNLARWAVQKRTFRTFNEKR